MEVLDCRDCVGSSPRSTLCGDGCEITAGGAVCKGKCKEEWCDDGDTCTIDWCYQGECRHERKSDCCPQSCDDGDSCTTDYCDGSDACQHAQDPACRCQNVNCNDGDGCTIDYCDSTTGACIDVRRLGCDNPDDNNDVSSMSYEGSAQQRPQRKHSRSLSGFNLFILDRLDSLGYGAMIIPTMMAPATRSWSFPPGVSGLGHIRCVQGQAGALRVQRRHTNRLHPAAWL